MKPIILQQVFEKPEDVIVGGNLPKKAIAAGCLAMASADTGNGWEWVLEGSRGPGWLLQLIPSLQHRSPVETDDQELEFSNGKT